MAVVDPTTGAGGAASGSIDRRALLAGAAAASAAATLARAQASSTAKRSERGVLVVLFLRGGVDALSLCAPYGDDDLYRARSSLAVPPPDRSGGAIDLDGFFGLLPAAEPLLPAFRSGRLAVVQAVGSPRATRSHFDAMRSVEGATATTPPPGASAGWIARLLETVPARRGAVLRAVSLERHLPDALGGARAALAIPDPRLFGAFPSGSDRESLRALSRAGRDRSAAAAADALDSLELVERMRFEPREPARGAGYPSTELGRKLAHASAWIRARIGLEVLTLDAGGFDLHRDLGPVDGHMAGLGDDLARSLSAFERDLGPELERVTLVAVSEFGRRVACNQSGGADHGRGGIALVLGGGVRGGRVLGRWPGLQPAALDQGDLAATTDVRDVLVEAATSALGAFDAGAVMPGHAIRHLGITSA